MNSRFLSKESSYEGMKYFYGYEGAMKGDDEAKWEAI